MKVAVSEKKVAMLGLLLSYIERLQISVLLHLRVHIMTQYTNKTEVGVWGVRV